MEKAKLGELKMSGAFLKLCPHIKKPYKLRELRGLRGEFWRYF